MTRPAGRPPVLSVRDVRTRFRTQGGGMVHAVNGISFDLHEGELLGVVGESGSGKSVTMLSLLKLLPMPPAEIASGRALLEGEDLLALADSRKILDAPETFGRHLDRRPGTADEIERLSTQIEADFKSDSAEIDRRQKRQEQQKQERQERERRKAEMRDRGGLSM